MSLDLVNQVFRESERYTGDGLPDEPLNAPLPYGDRRTGPHHSSKAEIREALRTVFETIPRAEAAAAAAEAAAELALSYISDAVSQGNVPIYSTALAIAALEIPEGISAMRTNGYATPGDGGGALYIRAETEPTHAGKLQDDAGEWWELAEPVVTPRMLGWTSGDGWAVMRNLMALNRPVIAREPITATVVTGETFTVCGREHDLSGLTVAMPTAFTATTVCMVVAANATVNTIRITGASGLGNVQRFLGLNANVEIGLIDIDCATPTGLGNDSLDGFIQIRANNVRIGRIRTRGVDWVGKAYQCSGLRIAHLEIDGIMHGLSIDECTDFWVGRAVCRNKSALAGPDPGNNLLTIGTSDDGQVDLVVAEDTAEHGIYVANRCRRITFDRVITRRTGQCGFKCRSGFGSPNSESITINSLRVEDAAYGSSAGTNEDGLRVEYATNFTVGHIEVLRVAKLENEPSCYDGIYLNAVNGFTCNGGLIERAANAAVRIVDIGGENRRIVIDGLRGYDQALDAVVIDHSTGNALRHLMMTNLFFNVVGRTPLSIFGGGSLAPSKCYVELKYAQAVGPVTNGGGFADPDMRVALTEFA